ncbi:MAG TPA: hypothetical protein VMR74_07030 [Gammaproteobacteria bacterium]|nr:hypothetical protein [Gammaproteobacteria bacterium]
MSRELSASSRKIPVVFCIDIEPDEFFVDRVNPKPWAGFEFSHGYLQKARTRFEAVTGQPVRFNWFLRMDPQVAIAYGDAAWPAQRYAEFFQEYRGAGDEIGLHVHTYRWLDDDNAWLDDCGNPEWITQCLRSSSDSFKAAFGTQARSIRFGNYWLSTAAVNEAEALGFEIDLTIEPGLNASKWQGGKKPRQTAAVPDYYRVPRFPYVPSRINFKKVGDQGDARSIMMMPLTSAYLDFGWGLRGIKRRLGRLKRNGLSGHRQHQPLSMWKTWAEPDSFADMLDRALSVQSRPYLAFAVRSDMHTDYRVYDRCLEALLNHPAASRFVFCTPYDAMRYLSPVYTSGSAATA